MGQREMKQTEPVRVLPFSVENLRALLPTPKMLLDNCSVCHVIGNGGSRMVKGGTVEYDTIPAAVQHLNYFMRLGEQVETNWLNICPHCDRLYYCEESSEFLIPDSEEYQRFVPIQPEAVLKLSAVSWANATGKGEIHEHDDGTWCIVRDAEKLQQVMQAGSPEENTETGNDTPKEMGGVSNEMSRVERTHKGFSGHGRRRPERSKLSASSLLVQEILAAAGQPVSAHTLTIQEMEHAVKEGRVLQVHYWSHFGEGEASFSFATDFGIVEEGRVHPTYFVFPRPIPLLLRCQSESDWEKTDDVFAAFGIHGA